MFKPTSESFILTHCHLNDHTLECIKHHAYLQVILDQTIPFSPHIENIVSRATKMLKAISINAQHQQSQQLILV